jgi:hypothetical protein
MDEHSNPKTPNMNISPTIDLAAGRRAFIKTIGAGAAAAAILSTTGAKADSAPSNLDDLDILTFALNLEYLEAEFYLNAATGTGLAANEVHGKGGVGRVAGGRKVNFSNPLVSDYCQEIAADENNHVKFLRSALGNQVVGRPTIDIGTAFTTAAQAAGVIAAGQTFDPYADDVSFLLGAYIFEDVGVTAYSGAAPFITDKTLLAAAAGILAVEAYHAGLVRTLLFSQQNTFVTQATAQISNLRAVLTGKGVNDDQGIGANQSTLGGGPSTPSNIVPTDANSVAYARTPRQVANIVMGARGAKTGLFFPAGLTGDFAPLYAI